MKKKRLEKSWTPFVFDSKHAILSSADWSALCSKYINSPHITAKTEEDLLCAKEATYKETRSIEERDKNPNYGFQKKHDGGDRLKDFFLRNKMPFETRNKTVKQQKETIEDILEKFSSFTKNTKEAKCTKGITETYPMESVYSFSLKFKDNSALHSFFIPQNPLYTLRYKSPNWKEKPISFSPESFPPRELKAVFNKVSEKIDSFIKNKEDKVKTPELIGNTFEKNLTAEEVTELLTAVAPLLARSPKFCETFLGKTNMAHLKMKHSSERQGSFKKSTKTS